MRRHHSVATFAFAALIGLAVVALVHADNPTSPGVARFRETQVTHISTGVHAGATEVWRTEVWLLQKDQAVGTGVIACIRADRNTSIRECSGTYILPRGRIQLAGEIISHDSYLLSVVGGSGVYGAAGGVMVVLKPGVVAFFLT